MYPSRVTSTPIIKSYDVEADNALARLASPTAIAALDKGFRGVSAQELQGLE